jgi:hypothetical protein
MVWRPNGYNFGIMLKRLTIFAAIAAFMAVYALGQSNKTSGDKDKPHGNHLPSTISVDSHDDYTHPQQTPPKPIDETFSLHTAIKKPEWWAIAVALGTMILIFWQSKATADAAKAALLQANHILTSERAWMIAEPGDAAIPPEVEGATGIRWTGFSVRFVNKGKTPAFLMEAACCGKVLPHGEELPAVQAPYGEKEIFKWDGKGLPLLPGADVHKNLLGTWANDPVKITRGFDVLWIYGYIRYSDAFENIRETWYCYRWVHEIERYQASGFIAGGPESYNRAT